MATTATDDSGRTRRGKKAHPDKVRRDQLLRSIERRSARMAERWDAIVEDGYERRHEMLELNRQLGVPYSTLCDASGLAESRVTTEIGKAKKEAGVTSQHPRYPAFGRNGKR